MPGQEILELIGDFTWGFADSFFIETVQGNFVWSDPAYSGDHTPRPFEGDYMAWCLWADIPFGRDKGKHLIQDYCRDEEGRPPQIILSESGV